MKGKDILAYTNPVAILVCAPIAVGIALSVIVWDVLHPKKIYKDWYNTMKSCEKDLMEE